MGVSFSESVVVVSGGGGERGWWWALIVGHWLWGRLGKVCCFIMVFIHVI